MRARWAYFNQARLGIENSDCISDLMAAEEALVREAGFDDFRAACRYFENERQNRYERAAGIKAETKKPIKKRRERKRLKNTGFLR